MKKYSSRFQTALSFSHESISFAFAAHGLPRRAKRSGTRGAFSPRHSGAQAKHASPESIPTVRGYGFRPSPLSRLGRNDKLNGLIIGALHRIRDNTPRTRPQPYSLVKQHMFLRSRGAFLRPGFASFASRTPRRGGRSAESRTGACEAPVGPARNAAGQALARRLASLGGRSPPGAPPWRFWAPVPRFPHRNCFRIGHSELLASGS